MSTSNTEHGTRFKEQQLLFSEESLLPESLPNTLELKPSMNLSGIFDECHNYIYANEGLLKDKIFHEVVKLLIMKLYDEQSTSKGGLQFGITSSEYKCLLTDHSSNFEERMTKLFHLVRRKYQFLFLDDILRLKPLSMAYIVSRLQHISLTKTPGDIKGQAFQVFVYRHQRGDRGEFFTPHPIVTLAVEMIAPKPDENVIDPACGSGGFLIETILHICRNNPDLDKSAYIRRRIRGIEFNPDVALSAMMRIAFEGGTGTEVACSNSLIESEQQDNTFDVVLTNPPFGSKGKVEDQRILKSYILARKWNKRQAKDWEATRNVLPGQSPEVLFIEKCLKLLRPGGRLAIVLPDGLLQNVTNSHIRFWIRSQAKILAVISIPQDAFVPYGTGIKTSLLILQKLPSKVEKIFMALIHKIGYDVKGQPIYKRDDNGRMMRTSSGLNIIDSDLEDIATAYNSFKNHELKTQNETIYPIPEQLLNTRFDAEHYKPNDRELIQRLRRHGAKPLSEIADILNEADDFRLVSGEEIRYIAISDVDSRTMQVVSQQIIKVHDAPSRATYRVHIGDIITATSGASTGTLRHATSLITADEDGAICSNGFAVLRNIHGVKPLFLLAYMRTEYFLRQVRRLMTGHAIPSISGDDLSKVLVPILSTVDQERIAKNIASIQSMRKEALRIGESIVTETESLIGDIIS